MYLRLRALVTYGGDGSGWVVVGWEWGGCEWKGEEEGGTSGGVVMGGWWGCECLYVHMKWVGWDT